MVKKEKIYNFLKRPLGNRNDKCVNLFEAVKDVFFKFHFAANTCFYDQSA